MSSDAKISSEALECIQRLRILLHQRSKSMLGCDYKAKTVRDLTTNVLKIDRLLSFVNNGFYALAYEVLIQVCAVKPPSLARILKGADADILPSDQFVLAAELAINNLQSVLAPELQRLISRSAKHVLLC